MSREHGPDVAKNGGDAAAYPRNILEQDQRSGNQAPIMVISAPGVTDEWPVKLTDMVLDGGGFDAVRDRFQAVVQGFDPDGRHPEVRTLMADLPESFGRWEARGNPKDAFGEYWMARLYAAYSGREFVDAADVILLDDDGRVDFERSAEAISERFAQAGQYYIVPGYYGSRPDGSLRTLGRNSSDTTGAIIAKALRSRRYYKHINQDGFLSGPPGIVNNAFVRENLTYRELRELSLGGYEVLAAGAFQYLPDSGIETVICSADGPRVPGTLVTDDRDWRDSPLAGVTGRTDIVNLSFQHTGLNDEVGATRPVFDLLEDVGIPYQSMTTGTDNVAVLVMGRRESELLETAENLRQLAGNVVNLRPQGSVHIVGEGIADHRPLRFHVLGEVALALGAEDIEDYSIADSGESAELSIFVDPETLKNGGPNPLQIAHDSLMPYFGPQ